MKIHSNDFRVWEGDEVNLKKWPTKVEPVYKSKEQYKKLLEEHVAQLSSQQQLLYATNRHAILLIFQAMDAAGKDGAIRPVMSGVNPQGCQVFSFKHPSAGELEHDFLWRTTRDLPERGKIGIFNRSYYEEVLILRVHPEILRSEAIPDTPRASLPFISQRATISSTTSSIWSQILRSIGCSSMCSSLSMWSSAVPAWRLSRMPLLLEAGSDCYPIFPPRKSRGWYLYCRTGSWSNDSSTFRYTRIFSLWGVCVR